MLLGQTVRQGTIMFQRFSKASRVACSAIESSHPQSTAVLLRRRGFSSSVISAPELRRYRRDGFIILKDLFSPEQKAIITRCAREIQQWPIVSGQHMHYYEAAPTGGTMLCRTENYLDYHAELHEILGPSSAAAQAAAALLNEDEGCVLFKERINYKLAGGGGFAAHQDAPAWSGSDPTAPNAELHFMNATLNLNVAVDHMTEQNGCLYVVPGLHQGQRCARMPYIQPIVSL